MARCTLENDRRFLLLTPTGERVQHGYGRGYFHTRAAAEKALAKCDRLRLIVWKGFAKYPLGLRVVEVPW